MNLNLDKKIMFFHIPKNAGVSIMTAFGLEKNKQINRSPVCALTTLDYYGEEYLKSLIKFSIIRNPYDRLVSLYHFRKTKNDLYNLYVGNNVSGGDKTTPEGTELSFKEWVMDSRTRGAGLCWTTDPYLNSCKETQVHLFLNYPNGYNSTLEWVNQIHYITDENGILVTDEILRFENINEELENFCNKYNINNPILPKLNSSPGSTKRNYVDFYDDELIEFVNKLFKDDIDYLDYKFGD
tara:strand:- start:283 stop:999 length:717 start_codon:yes stop_codon:yes gene_type:complete